MAGEMAAEAAAIVGKQQPARMSYEEYLALPSEGPLVEWVDGEVIYHMPPTLLHQDLVVYLATLLGLFVSYFDLGRVWAAPVELKCRPDGNSREPDVLYLANESLHRAADDKRINGPADLVIEIVSDDSVSRDLDDKFIEYQECGVPEYWIIDPRERRKRALFYQRGEDGLFESVKLEKGGIYRSKAVPGFWLKVEWLWSLPDPQLTFGEIAGFSERVMEELRTRKAGVVK